MTNSEQTPVTMRKLILIILREQKMLKIIELALQVWARQNHKVIPNGVWHLTSEEHNEVQKTERLLSLFLPKMQEDRLVEIDPDYKYICLAKELV